MGGAENRCSPTVTSVRDPRTRTDWTVMTLIVIVTVTTVTVSVSSGAVAAVTVTVCE